MRFYFDTSAYSKRFITEFGSDQVIDLCKKADVISTSMICLTEMISVFNRLLYSKIINENTYKNLKSVFIKEMADVDVICLNQNIIEISYQVLEQNLIKTLDTLHIASALYNEVDFFVSADIQQLKAAKKMGLEIIRIKQRVNI